MLYWHNRSSSQTQKLIKKRKLFRDLAAKRNLSSLLEDIQTRDTAAAFTLVSFGIVGESPATLKRIELVHREFVEKTGLNSKGYKET